MKRIALLAWLLLALPCAAQEIPLEIKGDVKTVKVDRVVIVKEDMLVVNAPPFSVHAPAGGILYSWQYPNGVEAIRRGNKLDVSKAPTGRMTIAVEYAVVVFDKVKQEILTDIKTGQVTFSVGAVPEPPVPPKPPTPPDPPTPPIPVPTGLRVVFVTETSAKHTKEQLNIMNSSAIAAYLNAKAAKTNGHPDWRKYDKDQNVTFENPVMRKLWEAVKPQLTTLPALVIVTDQKGEVLPLPETEAATLELLKKHAGE